MNILRVRCQTAEDFHSHYQAEEPNGGVFCPTTEELPGGTEVVVEIVCRALPNRVLIRGRVVSWRPALPRMRVRAGAFVRFEAEEAAKRNFVLEAIGGKRKTPRRRHTRLPLSLPCKMRVGSEIGLRPAELKELSVSGALFAADIQPMMGTDVVLVIVPPGAEAAMDLSSKVLYHAGPRLTGVKFLFREGGGSRRLRELVRRFKNS